MRVPRLGRRQFLALAALGGALATCGRGAGPPPTATPQAAPGGASLPPGASPAVSPAAVVPARGGVARIESPRSFTFDTFDAALSGDVSTLEVLGRTLSRVVQYVDADFTTLAGDLAAGWEQPDATTLVLRLAPGARWQESGGRPSRPVTAHDVATFLQRAVSNARSAALPAAQRSHDWLRIDGVEAPTGDVVRVKLSGPDPFILNTLAGPFALVQSPEAIEMLVARPGSLDAGLAAGSGPFRLVETSGGALRFAAARGGHRQPLVDELLVVAPAEPQERFRRGEVHEVAVTDPRQVAALAANSGGEVLQFDRFAEHQVITTLWAGGPPWDDPRLRAALAAALYPPELTRRLVGAGAPAHARVFGPGQPIYVAADQAAAREATTLDEERARARALWKEAAGAALGTVVIDFPNVFDPRFAASSAVTGMLREALGDQFRAAVEPYTTIARKLRDHEYGGATPSFWFGWGPQFLDPVPARHLHETYSSRGPNFAASGFVSASLDAVLDRAVETTDVEERELLVREAMATVRAEGGGAILPWFTQEVRVFRRKFLRRGRPGLWWDQHLDVRTGVDTAAPDYRPLP